MEKKIEDKVITPYQRGKLWFGRSEVDVIIEKTCNATIEEHEKAIKFLKHIENHLGKGQYAICKICGKSVDEIDKTEKLKKKRK